jgi:hypothetical protein
MNLIRRPSLLTLRYVLPVLNGTSPVDRRPAASRVIKLNMRTATGDEVNPRGCLPSPQEKSAVKA